MAELYPSFQIAKYIGNEATIGPGGEKAEGYASPNPGAKYGYYGVNEGFVFDSKFYPDFFQWPILEYVTTGTEYQVAGPRSIICMRDLGALTSLTVYARGDYVNRDLNTTQTLGVVGTGYGSADSQLGVDSEPIGEISLAVYNASITPNYLWVHSDAGESGDHNFLLASAFDREWQADNTITTPAQIGKYIISGTKPIPTLGMCLWIGFRNQGTGPRMSIVGVEVNGVLFGIDENGNEAPERPSLETETVGDLWWQDLQNCIQSSVPGSTGVSKLPFSDPTGTLEEGYRWGYYEWPKIYSPPNQFFDNVVPDENGVFYNDLFLSRIPYETGAALGLKDALDEGGSPYNPPNGTNEGSNFGETYGIGDGRWAGFAAGRPMSGTLVADIEAYAQAFYDPNLLSVGDDYSLAYVDAYLGTYAGSIDGQLDAGGTYDEDTGQTGSAIYNTGYVRGYQFGWIDNGGNPGDIPEGEGG